jgi:signal transduction histidine kinase
MKQQAGRLVVIESLAEPRIHLRGSILPAEGDVGFFLLLSPWITRLDDIERLGLTLSDFAPHDPVADLLFLHQANTAALDDTRRLAAELRERKDRLATIFSLSPDGFVALGADNRVTYVNEAFTRLTGTTEVQVADATAEQLDALLATRAAPSVPFGGLEIDPPAPEDNVDPRRAQPRHLLQLAIPEPRVLSYSVRHGEGGSKVLYFRDITRETEVDRMKSEFLSTAAHELRTPMASVFGFSELLLKRDYDEKTRRDLLSTIHRQAGTLIHLLNELLDLARIEARQGKDFKIAVQPLRPVIEGTVAALLVPNDPRKVTLDLPETLPHCAVDAEKLAAGADQPALECLQVLARRWRDPARHAHEHGRPEDRHPHHRPGPRDDARAGRTMLRALLSRRRVGAHSRHRPRPPAREGDRRTARRPDRHRIVARQGHDRDDLAERRAAGRAPGLTHAACRRARAAPIAGALDSRVGDAGRADRRHTVPAANPRHTPRRPRGRVC